MNNNLESLLEKLKDSNVQDEILTKLKLTTIGKYQPDIVGDAANVSCPVESVTSKCPPAPPPPYTSFRNRAEYTAKNIVSDNANIGCCTDFC